MPRVAHRTDVPLGYRPEQRGQRGGFAGDPDIMDTWATSSLTPQVAGGWLEDPALYDLVFTNRNKSWADWIDARMDKPGTVFLAVGAGHLSGKNNVRDLLETRGISSARVE